LGEGRVNEVIKGLNSKVSDFLGGKDYDENDDGKINYSE
jgi:hypothetical protein